jgi:hypothetical protein
MCGTVRCACGLAWGAGVRMLYVVCLGMHMCQCRACVGGCVVMML